MVNIKWIERALGKREIQTWSLDRVYSDAGRLVATDGFRLHLGPEPAEPGITGFLDGLVGRFPNYRDVIPRSLTEVALFRIGKRDIDLLKKVSKLAKVVTADFAIGVGQEVAEATVRLEPLEASLTFKVPMAKASEAGLRFKINLGYLVDAIEPFVGKFPLEVSISADLSSETAPFVFRAAEHTAMIKPVRAD